MIALGVVPLLIGLGGFGQSDRGIMRPAPPHIIERGAPNSRFRHPNRRMLPRISSAVFTHLNGAPRWLWASTYARIAARSCERLVCEPRLSTFSVTTRSNHRRTGGAPSIT